jgi:malate dehydrogenase (oxaloacetate-decarboxylating)
MPDVAKAAGAFIVAPGRSDFPNHINNVLAFPGSFRGALDNKIKQFNDDMFLAAAKALAGYVKNPTVDMILPSPLDKGVVKVVAEAIHD